MLVLRPWSEKPALLSFTGVLLPGLDSKPHAKIMLWETWAEGPTYSQHMTSLTNGQSTEWSPQCSTHDCECLHGNPAIQSCIQYLHLTNHNQWYQHRNHLPAASSSLDNLPVHSSPTVALAPGKFILKGC